LIHFSTSTASRIIDEMTIVAASSQALCGSVANIAFIGGMYTTASWRDHGVVRRLHHQSRQNTPGGFSRGNASRKDERVAG